MSVTTQVERAGGAGYKGQPWLHFDIPRLTKRELAVAGGGALVALLAVVPYALHLRSSVELLTQQKNSLAEERAFEASVFCDYVNQNRMRRGETRLPLADCTRIWDTSLAARRGPIGLR